MRRRIEKPSDKSGAGTLLLAGVIILGFGVVGYVFFVGGGLDMDEDQEQAAAFEVERVVPLSESEVVGRAQEGVEVSVFAAALEAEKGPGGAAGRSKASKKRGIEIDDIGARGGQPGKLSGKSAASRPSVDIPTTNSKGAFDETENP